MKAGDKVKIKSTGEVGIIKTHCDQCEWHVTKEDGVVECFGSEKELELLTQTPDEKVLDYLERAEKIICNFLNKEKDALPVSSILEIAKLLQRETNKE